MTQSGSAEIRTPLQNAAIIRSSGCHQIQYTIDLITSAGLHLEEDIDPKILRIGADLILEAPKDSQMAPRKSGVSKL